MKTLWKQVEGQARSLAAVAVRFEFKSGLGTYNRLAAGSFAGPRPVDSWVRFE
jgi:hypothetical protein